MRSLALALLALSLFGCSIFNKPDRGRLDAFVRDGGPMIDAWVPPDTNDGGFDAHGDAHVCDTGENACDDGKDDDCDGLVDCADPDCVVMHAAACCMTGGTTSTEHFDKVSTIWSTAGNWTAAPSMSSAISAAGKLVEMGSGPPIGMVNNTCMHVDLGTEIRFTMRASPCTGTECDGRMEVVVGPSTSFAGMLTDDLAVRGTAIDPGNLQLQVVQGGSVRATSTMPFGVMDTSVVVTLSPGIANELNAIVGTVVVSQGVMSETLASQLFVTDRDIFGTSSCHGLHLGVQGVGNHVALDDITITELDCSNPARFDAVRDDADSIDAVTVSVSSADHLTGWGRGGIGDPALFEGVLQGTTAHRFTLLFDGSPVDRASDVIGHLPLTVGGADTTATGTGGGLALIDDCSQWTPRGGPIACTPPALASGHDLIESPLVMRDPTLYPEGGDAMNIMSYRAAWVGETAPGSALALYVGLLDGAVPHRILGVPTPTTIEGEDDACSSIRNPLLVPFMGTGGDYLLFYVCDSMFPPVVHAARLSSGSGVATRVDIAFGMTELGPLARTGVTDIAGVVFNYATGTTYRLWLTSRPSTTETAVLFVEGRVPPGAPAGTLPVFTPFAGNPVLTERSPVFGSCALGCQLHGITATRISNEHTRVRLLIERWVDTGSGLTYGLVPLESIWPTD